MVLYQISAHGTFQWAFHHSKPHSWLIPSYGVFLLPVTAYWWSVCICSWMKPIYFTWTDHLLVGLQLSMDNADELSGHLKGLAWFKLDSIWGAAEGVIQNEAQHWRQDLAKYFGSEDCEEWWWLQLEEKSHSDIKVLSCLLSYWNL